MFELCGISKMYRRNSEEVAALSETTLSIKAGEYVAIVGPSGSGKTTMLSMLGGMLAPTTGKMLLDGESVYDLPVHRRAELRREKIGFVFQTFNLISYLTALENVQAALMLSHASPAVQRARAAELLERVGLQARLHHKPCELSIGQQQRVALARTLANDPLVVLADEPTGNLDPATRTEVLEFLEELPKDGRTVIMVTHDPSAADRAWRTLKLADGCLVSDITKRGLRAA